MELTQNFLIKNLKSPIVAIIVFIFSAGTLILFQTDSGGKNLFMFVCIVSSYYSYHNLGNTYWRQISKGVLVGFATLLFLFLIIQTIKAATTDAEFDFMCFYMQGLLGVHKLSFYDPHSFTVLLEKIPFHYPFTNNFKLEILDVGLLSPPITMLFFAPFASLDYHTSRIIISILIFTFIIITAMLANVVFIKNEKSIYSFLFIFIIEMLIPGTNETIGLNQTNFFILFFLMLVLKNINEPIAGVYLALSLIVKPISGILILFFIINKNWKSLIYFFITGAFLIFITAIIWGFQNFIDFLNSPPTKRLPQFLYEQNINQSLIAVLNRNLQILGISQNIINILFFLAAAILVLLTCVSSKYLCKINPILSFFPFLLCMVMIYPSSLHHYMIYLIPVIIYFLCRKETQKYSFVIILLAMSFLRTEVFFSYLILWSFLFYVSILIFKSRGKEEILNKLL